MSDETTTNQNAPAQTDAAPTSDAGDDTELDSLAAAAYRKGMDAAYAKMRRGGQLGAQNKPERPHPIESARAERAARILARLEGIEADVAEDHLARETYMRSVRLVPDRAKGAQSAQPGAQSEDPLRTLVGLLAAQQLAARMPAQPAAEAPKPPATADLINREIEHATKVKGSPLSHAERLSAMRSALRAIKVVPPGRNNIGGGEK